MQLAYKKILFQDMRTRQRRKVKRMRTMKGGLIGKEELISNSEWLQRKNDPDNFQNITDPRQQNQIGRYYRDDTPPNLPEAIKWFTKAAEQKFTLAILSLIKIYEANGDTDKLLYWLHVAVNGFDKPVYPIIFKLGDTLIKSAVELYTKVLKTAPPNGQTSTDALKRLVGLTSMMNRCKDADS